MGGNPLQEFTLQALEQYGTRASKELQRRLAEDRTLCATHCDACDETTFPPREFCPTCFSDTVTWREIGAGATLYAFTTQNRGLRFTYPDVIGVVEIPGVGLVMSPIAGTQESLSIGDALEPEVLDIHEGLCAWRFRPAGAAP
jgi:uncharacterized OB-fold protein